MIRWTPDGRPPRRSDPPGTGLLLDRDGCLTVEEHHLTDPARLTPLPGAREAVDRAVGMGRRVAVVTNQSVVGRGLVTPDVMVAMHTRLAHLFPAIEAIYHCPHRPDQGCDCRKPSPSMPAAAVDELGLDPARTILVGDKLTDVEAGWAAGLDGVLVRTGHGAGEADRARAAGAPVVDDLGAAVALLAAPTGPGHTGAESPTVGNHVAHVLEVHLAELRAALDGLEQQHDAIEAAATALATSLDGGGTVLAAGNGGSAAEAQHFTAELLGRLRPDRDREPLRAVALHADTSTVTAAANDYGYDEVFARQVRALGRPGDVFLGLSTSASSRNVVRAAEDARAIGMTTVALVGGTSGPLHDVSDHVLTVPSNAIGAIQEGHLVLVHVLVERAEDLLFGPDWAA